MDQINKKFTGAISKQFMYLMVLSFGFVLPFLSAEAFTKTETRTAYTKNVVITSSTITTSDSTGGIAGISNKSGLPSCSDIQASPGVINNSDPNSVCYQIQTACQNSVDNCKLICSQHNVYNYDFTYSVFQNEEWKPIASSQANKCDQLKLTFTPKAEWFVDDFSRKCEQDNSVGSVLSNQCTAIFWGGFSPPTDLLACADQADCLSKATEASLPNDTFGKGVQKVPADFVTQTEKSLTSSNPYMKCTDGVCTSFTSGDFPLNATAPAGSYFGQCRGFGVTINTPEVIIPAVTSDASVTIANRPPVPTVSFDKSSIAPSEEANVTCDIVDPDECSDKIAKVKWTCADSTGNSNNCFIWKEDTGIFTQGSAFQDLVPSEQSNPFRANAKFKATTAGNYSVTCEATDNDANNPMTGTGINGITVAENCGADGICNANCPADPDCGVVAAHNGYCAIISQDGGSSKTLCGESGTAKYNAYVSGIDAQTYKWKCAADSNEQVSTSPDITCAYNNSGSFLPSLSIVDKSGKETQCVTQASATVTKDSSCKIQVNNTNVNLTDQVEATLSKQCLTNGVTNWQATNGTILSKDSNSAKIKFNTSGTNQIKAQIVTPDGKTTDCGTSDINVKEKVQFGL